MDRLQPRATAVVPVFALGLAAGAAALFGVADAVGFLSDTAESVFVLTWLLGWVLLVWSAVVAGVYAAVLARRSLSRRSLSRRPVYGSEVALTVAAVSFIVLVAAIHPLWGTGSAVG
ncbi:MAG: hypothetical protein ABWZ69_06940 [Mycetocola sp.]